MVEIAQIKVSSDGNYSHTILAEGNLWKNQGEYTVKVTYGEGNIAETNFLFTPTSAVLETTDIIKIDCSVTAKVDATLSILEIT